MTEPQRANLIPLIIGMALTGLLLATLAYLARMRNAEEAVAVPELAITAPVDGAVTDSPLILRFTSTQPLELLATGWGYRRFHLHASVGGVEHMPAAADIQAVGPGMYQWTLQTGTPGQHRIYLGWADMSHRAITPGASDTITVEFQE